MGKNAKRRREAKNNSASDAIASRADQARRNPLGQVMTTTPAALHDGIRRFCATLDVSEGPRFLPVRPEPWSVPNDCHFNVAEKVRRSGGRSRHGWIIWEMPRVMLEAEFHAVWVSESGEMLDVTPKRDAERTILFQPDATRVYAGQFVDNVRFPLLQNEVLDEYLEVVQRIVDLQRQSFVDPHPGLAPLAYQIRPDLEEEFAALHSRRATLQRRVKALSLRD